jgi:steroid 5-alpha reductase family enzyme
MSGGRYLPAVPPRSRASSFVLVGLAHVAAAIAAWIVIATVAHDWPTWKALLAADVAATVVVFAASVALDNSSVYDPYWSVAPMLIAPWLFAAASPEVPLARRAVVLTLVMMWGARLTWNWARGWSGLGHEDWRYVEIRGRAGRAYWPVSFIGIHLMPTIWVYLGSLSLIPALATGTRPLGPLDALALIVTAGAIAIEATADEQLRAFRRSSPPAGAIMDRGLWAWSRHPNYLGEISFWWGLFLFALAADAEPGTWKYLAGPASITTLFVAVSVPLLDRRSVARRAAYADHIARVPGLMPRPWRRARSD